MTLTNEATAGLRKQIKEHKDCIKDLQAEIALIEKDFGKVEHPLLALIKKYPRLKALKPPTDEQCHTLIDLHGEAKVVDMMEKMNNHKAITKKVYFYSTISNWLKGDLDKAIAQSTGRVIKDNDYKQVLEEAEKQSAGQDKIKKGWITDL